MEDIYPHSQEAQGKKSRIIIKQNKATPPNKRKRNLKYTMKRKHYSKIAGTKTRKKIFKTSRKKYHNNKWSIQ